MNLSTALNSALSGLVANGRASSNVSDNLANALTPGYARRSLELASRGEPGLGVRVVGVVRNVDPAVLSSRRAADADAARAQVRADFYNRVTAVTGIPSDPDSISARMSAFENGLIAAASNPDSAQRLDESVLRAKDLADLLNTATDAVQARRTHADSEIGNLVDELNLALKDIEALNEKITAVQAGGRSSASLEDQRQTLVDRINQVVPVRVIPRDHGQIALFATGGAILLDGSAGEIGFTRTNTIVAEMRVESGALSGLTLNGNPISTDSNRSGLRGGELLAQFEVRDELGVAVPADLDAIARDLIERFEAPGLDATLAPGDPGLFTDDGDAIDLSLEAGLAGRIAVNSVVDPDAGGEPWRIRDGLGAAVPGPPGDARFLQALTGALTDTRVLGSGSFGTGQMSASDVGTAFLSGIAVATSNAEQRLTFATTTQTEMQHIELTQGVDTDAELAHLMLIEQAYGANARMIQAVSEMMDALLRI